MLRVLQVVFLITVSALTIVVAGVIFAAVTGNLWGREYVLNSPVTSVVKQCLTVWLGGAGILWVYGFVIIGEGWSRRSQPRNLLLLGILLFGSTLVSPYYYWKREIL